MKARLYLDLTKEDKDLVKIAATIRGLSMTSYVMKLVNNDLASARPNIYQCMKNDGPKEHQMDLSLTSTGTTTSGTY